MSSMAQTLLSTQPVGSSSARSTSSVMSVGTPLVFFGHATHTPPSGAAAFVSFGHAATSFDREVKKATTTSSGASNDFCQIASPIVAERVGEPVGWIDDDEHDLVDDARASSATEYPSNRPSGSAHHLVDDDLDRDTVGALARLAVARRIPGDGERDGRRIIDESAHTLQCGPTAAVDLTDCGSTAPRRIARLHRAGERDDANDTRICGRS